MLWVTATQRQVGAQDPDRVPAETYRTRHTRSQVSFQAHQDELLVAEVRYRPSRHPAVIERMNAELGTDYPTDMPVDAVGILLGFAFLRADEVRRQLEAADDPGAAAAYVRLLGTLTAGDLPAVTAAMRPLLRHPVRDVRAAVGNVAIAYNLEFLLHELSLLDALGEVPHDDDISRVAESLLDYGIPAPRWADSDDDSDEEDE